MNSRQAVLGIGGVFFKAREAGPLAQWYRLHLGIPVAVGATYASFSDGGPAVWATFPDDTQYFAPSESPFMLNYRVADLDAMLAQLRADGVAVEDRIEESEFGRFGWASDPAGNRFELWQPPPDAARQ